jgi:hypothetical protein
MTDDEKVNIELTRNTDTPLGCLCTRGDYMYYEGSGVFMVARQALNIATAANPTGELTALLDRWHYLGNELDGEEQQEFEAFLAVLKCYKKIGDDLVLQARTIVAEKSKKHQKCHRYFAAFNQYEQLKTSEVQDPEALETARQEVREAYYEYMGTKPAPSWPDSALDKRRRKSRRRP